jgi:hypothetical protein
MSKRSRDELEALDRDTLIAEAESAGVTRPRILTRPELVDEILLARAEDRASVKKARGFFGMARDLLFRAVEKGLNLPDAHQRHVPAATSFSSRPRVSGEIVPTVTLAEIYAAQGHTDRAVETLRGVLAREPEHAAAEALLSRLTADEYAPPPPPALPPEEEAPPPPEEDAPLAPEADAPLSIRGHAEDTCVALPDEGALRVGWHIRERAVAHYQRMLPEGTLAVRVVVFTPSMDSPQRPHRATRDVGVAGASGRTVVSGLPKNVVVRVAIGMVQGKTFLPISHSPLIERQGDQLRVRTPKGFESLPSELAALAHAD